MFIIGYDVVVRALLESEGEFLSEVSSEKQRHRFCKRCALVILLALKIYVVDLRVFCRILFRQKR